MAQRCPSALKTQKDMERIKLTKREKKVIRALQTDTFDSLSPEDKHAVFSLQAEGLVIASWYEGGEVASAHLSLKGVHYMKENPKLRNPVNWIKLALVVALLNFVITIIFLISRFQVFCEK